ncbi:hypothetical protein [Arthrobacter sp. TMN-50]
MAFMHQDLVRRLLRRLGPGLVLGVMAGLFVGVVAAVVTSGGTDNVLRSDVGWRAGLVAFAIAFLFTICLPSHGAVDGADFSSVKPPHLGSSPEDLSHRVRGDKGVDRTHGEGPDGGQPRYGQVRDPLA